MSGFTHITLPCVYQDYRIPHRTKGTEAEQEHQGTEVQKGRDKLLQLREVKRLKVVVSAEELNWGSFWSRSQESEATVVLI